MNLETMRGARVSVSEELASQILSEHPLLGRDRKVARNIRRSYC
jgi:hypothetical protein